MPTCQIVAAPAAVDHEAAGRRATDAAANLQSDNVAMTNHSKKQHANLGRTPAGTSDSEPAGRGAGGGGTPALFQHEDYGVEVDVSSPLVDPADYDGDERDGLLEAKVRDRIASIPAVDPSAIDVRCREGCVELRGEVPSKSVHDRLHRIVARTAGVARIEDRLC